LPEAATEGVATIRLRAVQTNPVGLSCGGLLREKTGLEAAAAGTEFGDGGRRIGGMSSFAGRVPGA
jgi:hypothetical protein